MQEDISAEFKADSIADKDDAGKAKTIIKKGVQAALKKLEEY
jgi:hypothetical protein